MSRQVQNKMEMFIKRDKVDSFRHKKRWTNVDLLERLQKCYGIDLKYKGFASLLDNCGSWKLLYAYALSDLMELSIYELFEMKETKQKKLSEEEEEGYV